MHETILSQWTTSLLSMEKKKEKVIGQCILHTPYTSWLAVMISLKIKLWFLCKSGLCKKHFPCDRCIYMDVKKSDSYMNVHLTKTISKREPATMITSLPAEFSHWHRAFARLASHVLKPLAFHGLHKPHRTYPSTKVTSHKLYWQIISLVNAKMQCLFLSPLLQLQPFFRLWLAFGLHVAYCLSIILKRLTKKSIYQYITWNFILNINNRKLN